MFRFLICVLITMMIASRSVHSSVDFEIGLVPTRSTCDGSVGDCLVGDDEEFDLDSEINRRIMATKKYISYGAMQRNSVPCSKRGASYYNCRSGSQANPYRRGCSQITRCRS